MGKKAAEYLRGDSKQVQFFDRPLSALFETFRERWLLPRAERNPDWNAFRRETYLIWNRDTATAEARQAPP